MWVVPIELVACLGLVLVGLAHWRARRGPPDPRERERRWLVIAAIVTVPFGPAILLHVERRLPAAPPDHWQEGIWGIWQGTSGDTWIAFAAILLLVRATMPALGWYAAAKANYPSASRQLRGRRTAAVSASVFTVVALIATSRIARGGAPDESFTELGHLTPGFIAGTEVDDTLADHTLLGSKPMPADAKLPPLVPQPAGPEPPPGPLRLFDIGFLLCRYACDPPAPRPAYLAGWDTWRPGTGGHVLLTRVDNGRVDAMLVEDVSFEPVALDRRDVWRLLRPPAWPLGLASMIAFVAVVVRRRPLASAWLFSEATAIVVYGYATFVGL